MLDPSLPAGPVPAFAPPYAAGALPARGKPRLRGWIHTWALLVGAVAGLLLVLVASRISTKAGLATAIYSLTVCALFGTSAVYHRVDWKSTRSRLLMRRADHSMIFVFIAGCYTPFTILALRPALGHVLLLVAWSGALVGVALKVLWAGAPRWLGVPLYLMLGWMIIPVVGDLGRAVGAGPALLLLSEGIWYTLGAITYATRWPDPWPKVFGHHEIFHTATVLGALCHYIAVWWIVLR